MPGNDAGKQLVWTAQRDGRIELEVTRRDGSKCHEGAINQLVADEEETLITIGKPILCTFGILRALFTSSTSSKVQA